MVGPGEKVFKTKVFRWLENAIIILIFANTISHKRAVLFSFELEFTESLIDILSDPKFMIGPIMVGLEEKVSK